MVSHASANLATQPRRIAGSSVRFGETNLADLLESACFDPGVDGGAQKGIATHELVLLGANQAVLVVLVLLGAGSFIRMKHCAVVSTEAAPSIGRGRFVKALGPIQQNIRPILAFNLTFSTRNHPKYFC